MPNRPISAGSIYIKSLLPNKATQEGFDLHRPLDKGGMAVLINSLISHGGEKDYETINKLAKIFFDKATELGTSTPLSDYENSSDERQTMFAEFEHKVREIMDSKLDKKDKLIKLDALAGSTRKHLNAQNLRHLVSRGSTAAKMAQSGARGNPDQLGIGTASPLMAFDVKGHPIPVAIKHSFAEGLSPAEFFAMSYGGRASTVLAQLSTAKPGELFKKMYPSLFHEVVTMEDCGTKNGILVPYTDSKSIVGRYQAGTNHLIDEHYYRTLATKGKIKIRSPMTCEAHEGICKKCYGIAANGHLPQVGENMGVIAAQSISEVLTQAMLSTKHQGGVAGGQRNVYEEANNLLSNPTDNFQDESTISSINGKVTGIKQTPLKDWEVYVNDKPYFVSREQQPVVHLHDNIKAGDPLSTGTINPRKLVELKGAGAGRTYLMNKLREVYAKKSSGLDPRHFELVAKNMMRHVKVDDPGDSGYLPGQVITVGQLHKHLKDEAKTIKLEGSAGKTLASGVLDMTPGTVLNGNHVDELHKAGITHVNVSSSNLSVTPMVPGLQTAKLLDSNWVSNLSFNRLMKTIQDAGALGMTSPIHSTDPVASYVMGSEFGEGEKGQY